MDRPKDTIICDLDGTIALDHKRTHFLHPHPHVGSICDCVRKGGRDWDSYFFACGDDEPCWPVIDLLRLFFEDGYNIRLLSGRAARVQAITEKWLRQNAVPYHTLMLRPDNNRVDDHELKLELAHRQGWLPTNTLFVLEDRQRVVDAWRRAGYTCFQVASGNF